MDRASEDFGPNGQAPSSSGELATQLAELRRVRDAHPLWTSRLLQACRAGALDRADCCFLFGQYQFYSRNFTRFISAFMANCDDDLLRARLSRNLWEEAGGSAPDRRHAELFRIFLRDSLGIAAPASTPCKPYTRSFVAEYLSYCMTSEPMASSAFLSLGTEGIVPRVYESFVAGLKGAGLSDPELEFFTIHIACDDDHAVTLEEIMAAYAGEPRWFETCRRAMCHALDLRMQFFDELFAELQRRRIAPLLGRINDGVSLCGPGFTSSDIHAGAVDPAPALYANRVDAEGIEFSVTRIPLAAEVLDPRRVEVPPGKRNERHRHAHETFIYILGGTGRVHVDSLSVDVAAGDSVIVPRWSLHQTENTGGSPLTFLAVTDYQLAKVAYLGDARAYRLNEAANQHRRE